jgi:hypothetical protein
MAVVTLATLRTRARERAEMPTAGFIADSATGIDAYINEGVQILHEKLVAAYGSNYVAKSTTLTTTSTGLISLPADFLALLGVSMAASPQPIPLKPFAQAERDQNVYSNVLPWNGLGPSAPRYQLFGGNIRLRPITAAGISLTFEYSPVATLLVNTSDTVDFPNGWERYVIVYTAIQMKMKQESSVTELLALLDAMDKQLKEMAELRDAGAPAVAADVYPDSEV